VPLIVAGAALIMALLAKLPILVWAGAALLGWIAGEVIATDPGVEPKLHSISEGPFGASLDKMLGSLHIPPQFAHGRAGAEYVCAALGVVVVLWSARSGAGAACLPPRSKPPSSTPRRRRSNS